MTSYTVTHTCGHTKTYFQGLFADKRDASAAENAATTDCQDCIEYAAETAECDDPIRNLEFAKPAKRGLFKASW
jgi:hypothetical protein